MAVGGLDERLRGSTRFSLGMENRRVDTGRDVQTCLA